MKTNRIHTTNTINLEDLNEGDVIKTDRTEWTVLSILTEDKTVWMKNKKSRKYADYAPIQADGTIFTGDFSWSRQLISRFI